MSIDCDSDDNPSKHIISLNEVRCMIKLSFEALRKEGSLCSQLIIALSAGQASIRFSKDRTVIFSKKCTA